MKITSDACVFGAFIDVVNASKILDIGTGTGLLSLMAAQRSDAEIHAVELDIPACKQATQNFAKSPWSNRLIPHQGSIQSLIQTLPEQFAKQFDVIICNPPFYSESIKSRSLDKRRAWHDENLNFQTLLESSRICLQENGMLHVLIPTDRMEEYLEMSLNLNLYPAEICNLRPLKKSVSHRVIISCTTKEVEVQTRELLIYQGHQAFSKEVRKLLSPFFLKV